MTAILYILRTGAHWASLNATGICSKSSAYRRFREWEKAGLFLRLYELSVLTFDDLKGLDWEHQMMDGCITKAQLGGEATGPSPVDRRKIGTKRSLLIEGNGIPIAVAICGANGPDHKIAVATIENTIIKRPSGKAVEQKIYLDKGYANKEMATVLPKLGYTPRIIPKRNKGESDVARAKRGLPPLPIIRKKPGAKAWRWKVERTHGWMNKFRRILTRWEKHACTYEAMLHLCMAVITFKQSGIINLPNPSAACLTSAN